MNLPTPPADKAMHVICSAVIFAVVGALAVLAD